MMKYKERIAATKLIVEFMGWDRGYPRLPYKLPKGFNSGIWDEDGRAAKECEFGQLRFDESMDWMLLVIDKIEKLKGKGAPFDVALSPRKWGCRVEYYESGHYKLPTTIVTVSIRGQFGKDEPNGMCKRGWLMRTAENKTEAVFIACYEFLKWVEKNKGAMVKRPVK